MIKTFFKQFLGRNKQEEEKIEEKRVERHDILNQAAKDINKVQLGIVKLKKHNETELDKMHKKMENITYKIAVATGGIKR